MSDTFVGIPEDFDEFWRQAADEAKVLKLDYHRTMRNDFDLPGFVVETLAFATTGGRVLNGWLAYPPHARRLPGFIWIPPYGRESMLPNAYGTRPGCASLSFNFFGHEAFHQEKYRQERGYFTKGLGSPESFVFRAMVQDCLVAARVIQAQIEADENRIGAMGMSQGGGLAIASGAWSPVIQAVCADMPFWGSIRQTLLNPVHRYPLKEIVDYMEREPLGRDRAMFTLGYFDMAIHASRCLKPTQVTLGLRDPASRPEGVRAIFDALPGKKELRELDWGHDWHQSMVDANLKWLQENV